MTDAAVTNLIDSIEFTFGPCFSALDNGYVYYSKSVSWKRETRNSYYVPFELKGVLAGCRYEIAKWFGLLRGRSPRGVSRVTTSTMTHHCLINVRTGDGSWLIRRLDVVWFQKPCKS